MINLYDILDAADGQLFGDPAAQIFSGFSFDPRHIHQGDLFVALKTEHGDGHHYMEEAVQAGAIGLMCTHPPSFDTHGITVMMMRDVEAALMRWTKFILSKYETTVVAVTGDRGKSTACQAISRVLGTRYKVYLGRSDYPGRFGIPLALSGLTGEHQLVVLELDPRQAGDMAEMFTAANPSVGVVVSLNNDDPASLTSREARYMLENLPENGLAILNYDDEGVRDIKPGTKLPPLTFSVDREGTSFGADLTAYNLITALDKTGFDLRYGGERHLGKWVPLLGVHQLYAILPALAVGLGFSIPLNEALAALTHLENLPGRMRPLTGFNNCLLVDDSFSTNLRSLKATLNWLQNIRPQASVRETVYGHVSPRGNIYVVLGELDGLDNRSSIDDIGEKLADIASAIVVEGDSASRLARSAIEHGFPLAFTHFTYSPHDAANAIKERLGPKDVVVIMGSEGARMERVTADLLAEPRDLELLARTEQTTATEFLEHPLHHTWVQIDMDAIAHNIQQIRKTIGNDCKLMAVVKYDGYGHGAVPVSTSAILNGADYLSVTSLDEGVYLRQAGITAPILVLGYIPTHAAATAIQNDLAITIYEPSMARTLNRTASGVSKRVNVHVRVDMGYGGIGVVQEDVVSFFRTLLRLEWLHIEGIYTSLDPNNSSSVTQQLASFMNQVKLLRAADFSFDYVHVAGSGTALYVPEARLDMVRCGSAIYGIDPSENYVLPKEFRQAFSWKTTVVQVKRIQGRLELDENGIPMPTRTRTVAVLPVGYADGLRTQPQSWKHVLLHGRRAEIIGQVDMYQTMVDVTEIDDVRVGDEAVLIGTQEGEFISVKEVAKTLGISSSELVTTVMARVPRRK